MTIFFKNSKKEKINFEPINANDVRMYVCGPTVYDRPHLGNARPVITFDILFRLFIKEYGHNHVTYVRNFTDIDDKIIVRANETNVTTETLTSNTIDMFHHDMSLIGNLQPTYEPKATETINEMIQMISKLIELGHAYVKDGNVFFQTSSYENYGSLSNRKNSKTVSGARNTLELDKEEEQDFVLWKPAKEREPSWQSPWSAGRPGWHIECSAMSKKYLGSHFDIHGGGIDLKFPHHENEMAQSCCANQSSDFVNHWIYNEMLMVDGKKMAKSKNNFFTIKDILDQGYSPNAIRMMFLKTHYSKILNWKKEDLDMCEKTMNAYMLKIKNAGDNNKDEEIIDFLKQDLNTHMALNVLHKWFKSKELLSADYLKSGMKFLGFNT